MCVGGIIKLTYWGKGEWCKLKLISGSPLNLNWVKRKLLYPENMVCKITCQVGGILSVFFILENILLCLDSIWKFSIKRVIWFSLVCNPINDCNEICTDKYNTFQSGTFGCFTYSEWNHFHNHGYKLSIYIMYI